MRFPHCSILLLTAMTLGYAAEPQPVPAADLEDTPDPSLVQNQEKQPWTDTMRRTTRNEFLPSAMTLPEGTWYFRVTHVAQIPYYEEPLTNLVGLDSFVKIGLLVSYAPTSHLDLSLERVNGTTLQIDTDQDRATEYDSWELTAKYQFMDRFGSRPFIDGWLDASVYGGMTAMLQNRHTSDSETSFNFGLAIERDLFNDRLRLGTGVVASSRSMFEAAQFGALAKMTEGEYKYLQSQGQAPIMAYERGTVAVPVTAKVAITKNVQVLGEAVFPIEGWETGEGPSLLGGLRYSGRTHEYTIFFSNTCNTLINSSITGGSSKQNLGLFGFAISVFF